MTRQDLNMGLEDISLELICATNNLLAQHDAMQYSATDASCYLDGIFGTYLLLRDIANRFQKLVDEAYRLAKNKKEVSQIL